jgi:hypothetical protein
MQLNLPSNPIGSIIQSIVGVFVGILFILLLAPVVLWFAESQNTAKMFSLTTEVLPTSAATGFIRTSAVANAHEPLACFEGKVQGNCLYYSYRLEELQYSTKDYCGTPQSNQRIIENRGSKCDSNGQHCENCYLVNESDWNTIQSETKFQPFSIGSYDVPHPDARIIGPETYANTIDATHRENMDYIKDNTNVLVAGDSDGKTISYGEKQFLLVSTKDYQATYTQLKMTDIFIAWVLRIVAFLILLFGYLLIFGPISAMASFVGKIPIIGKWIDGAVGGIIFLVSLLLAVVHFIILWLLIIILKNILVIAIVLSICGLLFYLYTHFRKPKTA